MKKLLALCLALTMCLSLAACGGSEQKETANAECELPVFLHLKDYMTSQKSVFSRK